MSPGMRGVLALMVSGTMIVPHALTAQEFSRWSSFCQGIEHTAGIALGDLDGDGDLDVIFANGRHLAEADWVFSNDGRGTFYGKRMMESQADRSYGVALGDLDKNGSLDAVVANDAGNRSAVYRNDGSGNFVSIAGLGSGIEGRRAVALGDFDGDGDLDVVLVGDGQDHLYLNSGAGLTWTQRPLGAAGGRGLSVTVADLDADRDLEIVVAERGPGRIIVYQNDGKANFSVSQQLGEGQSDPTGVVLGDLDGDRRPDIVAVNWERVHRIYLNRAEGGFAESKSFGTGAQQAWSVALGDMDGDGDLDAVVGATSLVWWDEDFNRDGTPDRFGNEARDAPSRVFLNDGKGNLTPGPAFGTGHDDTRPIALGDVDGDGDLDIVMGNDCQPNYVFFNSLRPTKPR